MTDDIAVRADLRHILYGYNNVSYNNVEFMLGATFQFGGVTPAAKPILTVAALKSAPVKAVAVPETSIATALPEPVACAPAPAPVVCPPLKLSQERADAVKSHLMYKFGIDGSRITAKGYGLTRPVASNKTTSGRMQNRRIAALFSCK